MPPKKDTKKDTNQNDNSGIPKNDVQFKFSFSIQSSGQTPPESYLMYEWFSSSDKFQKYDAGLVQNWTKKDSVLTFEKAFDSMRIDDDFCKNLSNHKFYLYFINPETSIVQQQIMFDYSSILMSKQASQYQFCSKTIKVHNIDSFTLKLSYDKQLLPQIYRQYLNPFEIHIIGALDIPNDSSNKYIPTYIKYTFFTSQNSIQSNPSIGHDKIIFQHKHVFLIGLMNPLEIKEKIRSNYLKFQFHDRDEIQNNKIKEDIQLFDIAKAIQEEMDKENPIEEDPKKKGAKKEEKKQPPKKQTKKDTKKKDAKIAQPILPKPIDTFKNNYGVAVFSLVQFLKSAVKTAKYKSPVIPRSMFQDFQSRNIDLNTTARNQMQKIVFSNNYFDCDTTLVVGFTLSYPIGQFVQKYCKNQQSTQPQQAIPIDDNLKKDINNYQRLVLFLDYKNSQSIKKIQDIFYQINMKAFNLKSKRQITTYLLKKQQKSSIQLDYLTGIQLIDPQCRVYIIQGLKNKSIHKIYQALPKDKYNTQKMKILKNININFTNRLYSDFNLEIKRIRFRPSLSQILLDPSIYIKSKVDEQICQNLNKISDLRKICDDLSTVESMNLWPNSDILIQIQRKYSQSLSYEDINGEKDDKVKKNKNQMTSKQTKAIDFLQKDGYQFKTADQFFGRTMVQKVQDNNNNNTNELGSTYKRNVHTKTFVRDKKSEQKYDQHLIHTTVAINQSVYIYASQKLNWYQKQKEQLRQKIQHDKNHIYTISKDYLSLSIDPYVIQQQQKKSLLQSQSLNYSPQKFSSLLIRTRQQRMQLPNQPSQQDIENMLKYPYHEEKQRQLEMKKSQRDKPVSGNKKDFQKYIKKKQFFQIPEVLETEKMARVQEEKMLKEEKRKREEEEKKKLLGESYIKVKKGYCADVVTGVDKYSNILEGTPNKKGLIDVNKKTKQKKIVQNYQVSLFQKEKRDNPSFNPLIRRDNQKLNVAAYQFNNYQKPQILTQTGIFKPLKQN